MWKKSNSETFIGCNTPYEVADFVLFGAPYDSTTSYRPGTRFGPKAIRSESYGIETYSPYLDRDLNDLSVFDGGDLELPFGGPEPALGQISEAVRQILEDRKIPVMTGGEHLVTYGAVREICKTYPDLHILHFDAHCDLREDYLGTAYSHACVLRRCWDLLGDGRIHQFGIRSGDREEFQFAQEHTLMHRYTLKKLHLCLEKLKGLPVYFTLDLDVLDPSIFPGTGTPEAGGVSFIELLEAVHKLRSLRIVGCDITELSPTYDPSGCSTAVACKILRELLLSIHSNT